MNKNTWTKYLGILAVALLLLGYVYTKNSRYEEKQSAILDFDRDAMTAIEILKSENSLRIEKSDSLWVFSSDTGDVAQHKLTRLFDALSGMKTGFITEKPKKYAQFNVDSTAMQLFLYSGEGVEVAHIYIGRSSTNYNSDYIRYPNDAKVYMTSGKILNTMGERASFWR